MLEPETQPSRITIDFSGAVRPDRGWIVGRVDPSAGRIELLSFDRPAAAPAITTTPVASPEPAPEVVTAAGDCTCPEYCERDHANE